MVEASGKLRAGSEPGPRALLAAALLIGLVSLAWPCQAQDLSQARAAFLRGDYQAAGAALSPKASRENLEGLLLLARVRRATGQRAQANNHLKHVLASAQGDLLARALTLKGHMEADEGRYEAALKAWDKAREASPNWRPARLAAGLLLLELGRQKAGRALLDTLADDYNDGQMTTAPELTQVGIAVWKLEYYQDANQVLQEAAEMPGAKHLPAMVAWGDLFLEKYNTSDARFAYEAALKVNPRYTPALLGMARVELEESYNLKAVQRWIEQALVVNPSMLDAIVLRAQLQIDDGDYEGAQATLKEVLKVNPRHLDALTLLAACAYLSDDPKGFKRHQKAVFKINPRRASFYTDISRLATRVHRYQEAIDLNKKALRLDPGYWPAFVELGINYTRVGDDQKGYEYLLKAHQNDPFHVRAFNMVKLYEETIPLYKYVDRGPLRFRFHRAELEVLSQVVSPLALEAFNSMGRRYHFNPLGKVHVEVFRDQETFSVRSVGLPHISPHGICFGRVVTSRSPAEGNFNWAEVIWHELAHVYHIQMSRSRVPRWFTEGLAEFEAGVARPEWRREQEREIVASLREDRLLGVGQLNHGFTHARNLGEVINAYFQSTLVIEFIESRWGFEALVKMLKLYGKGMSTAQVFKKTLNLDLLAFDLAFKEHLKVRYSTMLASFEPGMGPFYDLARHQEAAQRAPGDARVQGRYATALFMARRLDEAEAQAQRALALDPKEPHALFLMSFLALRAGELPTARQHLEAMIAAGHDGYSVRLRLGRLAARQDQRQEALKHYNQALIFFPRGAEAYRELARLHEGTPAREQLAESLRQITELDQSDFDTALRLSRLERELGELPLARRAATRALHIRPFSLEAQTQAGALALEEGDGDEAAARYKVALLLARGGDAQERAGLHLGLARALVISGDKPKARAAIQEAAALAPQHPMLEEVRALAR